MRIRSGDVILTRDLFNEIIAAFLEVASNINADSQRKCKKIADNLMDVFGVE